MPLTPSAPHPALFLPLPCDSHRIALFQRWAEAVRDRRGEHATVPEEVARLPGRRLGPETPRVHLRQQVRAVTLEAVEVALSVITDTVSLGPLPLGGITDGRQFLFHAIALLHGWRLALAVLVPATRLRDQGG